MLCLYSSNRISITRIAQTALRITFTKHEKPSRSIIDFRTAYLSSFATVSFWSSCVPHFVIRGLQFYRYGPSRTRGHSRSQSHKQQSKRGLYCNDVVTICYWGLSKTSLPSDHRIVGGHELWWVLGLILCMGRSSKALNSGGLG
jgi:hypothetical protein